MESEWTGILATSPEQQAGGTRGMQFGGNQTLHLLQIIFSTYQQLETLRVLVSFSSNRVGGGTMSSRAVVDNETQ